MTLSSAFHRLSFTDLPGWQDDDPAPALAAFARCGIHFQTKPYRTGSLGIAAYAFAQPYAEARALSERVRPEEARAFFERHFIPFHIRPEGAEHGFVTAYYEPEAPASREKTDRFRFPVYRHPEDLVEVDDANRPPGLDVSYAFALQTPDGLVPYHDREAIDRGALEGRGLELCWLADRIDLFFIHVQGAARLTMTDGETVRITYAAKAGHPFTSIGRVLASLGEIPLEKVTMQSIRAWLAANPHRVDEILWHNRSYIFFRETPPGDPVLGPVAAAKVQLQPGRSIAVDRLLHTFGTPFFINAPEVDAGDGKRFRRLMIAQDTGSAIVGPARGDLFIGTGNSAGEIAGVIRNPADFYVLVPRSLAEGA